MKSTRNIQINKILSKYLLVFLAVGALVVGYMKPTENILNTTVRFYTVNDSKISYVVDGSALKTINSFNEKFNKEYSEKDKKVLITPISGVDNEYLITIKSKSEIPLEERNLIFEEYKTKLIEDTGFVYHVSHLEYKDREFSYSTLNNIIWSVIRFIIIAVSIWYFRKCINKFRRSEEKYFEPIGLVALGMLALYFDFTLLLVVMLITTASIYGHCKRCDDYKWMRNVVFLGVAMRILVAIAILAISYLKFGTLFSYLQPDEIMYYSTGQEISNVLQSFSVPDFKAIVGLDQYGYNAFIGLIKLLNGSGSFFVIKVINMCVSSVFICIIYKFTLQVVNNIKIAKLSALIMAIMPTFPLFSAFALRDVIISFIMVITISQVIELNSGKCKNYVKHIIYFVLCCIALWYLRKFTLLILIGISIMYTIFKFTERKNISLIVSIFGMGAVGLGIFKLASAVYSFSIFDMIINYIKNTGIIEVIKGLILSMINLDFLTSNVGTIYDNMRLAGVRLLYPDTLMLVITFPIFIVGIVYLIKKNKEFILVILTLIFGLILIYRIEYGGWFLRIQLQILPYQYMIISAGIYKLFKNTKIITYLKL